MKKKKNEVQSTRENNETKDPAKEETRKTGICAEKEIYTRVKIVRVLTCSFVSSLFFSFFLPFRIGGFAYCGRLAFNGNLIIGGRFRGKEARGSVVAPNYSAARTCEQDA